VVAVKNTEPAKPAKTVPVKNNTAPASATTSTQTHTAAAAVKKPAEPAKIPQPVGHDYTGPVRIFLLSWPQRLDRNTGQLGLLSDVQEEIISGQYHYFLGNFTARNEADRMLSEIKNLGFRTAFLAPSK
jgi:cell division protein FtsN